MLRSTSQLGSEARATTDIIHMDTTIRTAPTIDRIGLMAITGLTIGAVGTVIITATIVPTTTAIGNRWTQDPEIRPSWLESDFEPVF
jgi:hypothetical protein